MAATIDLREFFVEGDDSRVSHVLLHITEPSTPQEREKGYFFALAEIENGDTDIIAGFQQIIDRVEAEYYAQETTDDALELALETANKEVDASLFLDTDAALHCIVGVLRDTTLTFTYHGAMHALVFYKTKRDTQCIDILEDAQDQESEQLFPSVLHGTLNTNDTFLVATPHISDIFSYDRMRKLLISRSPKDSAAHMERVLSDMSDGLSFGGIIFHVLSKKHGPRTGRQPQSTKEQGSVASLNSLISGQHKTAQTLSPPLINNLKEKLGELRESRNTTKKKKRHTVPQKTQQTNQRPRQPGESWWNRILIHLGRALVYVGLGAWRLLKGIGIGLWRLLIGLIIIVTNKNNGRSDAIDRLKKEFNKRKRMIDDMPLMSKLLLFIILVFACIFLSSIVFLRVQEYRQAKAQVYVNLVKQIEETKESAEASLLYNDKEKALRLFQQASEQLTTLPEKSKIQQETIERLQADIEAGLMKVRNIEYIDATVVVNLADVSPDARADQATIHDDQLLIYGKDDPQLYIWDMSAGNITVLDHSTITGLHSGVTPKELDTTIFLQGDAGIAGYTKDGASIVPRDIAFPENDVQLEAIDIYSQRLYTLDSQHNQIYKHNKTQTGYDKGEPWITDEIIDLSDAVSVRIDGDIFVLRSRGDVIKYHRGSQETFEIKGLDPALENPTELWTHVDDDRIIILEPSEKRLVILNKSGKLLKQLTSDVWQSPSGFTVDLEENIAYVVDNNIVYAVNL